MTTRWTIAAVVWALVGCSRTGEPPARPSPPAATSAPPAPGVAPDAKDITNAVRRSGLPGAAPDGATPAMNTPAVVPGATDVSNAIRVPSPDSTARQRTGDAAGAGPPGASAAPVGSPAPVAEARAEPASADVRWDGPLFVMERDGQITLDAECVGDPDAPWVPARWPASPAAFGLSLDATVLAISPSGVRRTSIEALSCQPRSDCLGPLILLALGGGPAGRARPPVGRATAIAAVRDGVLSERATAAKVALSEPRERERSSCGPDPDPRPPSREVACGRWRPSGAAAPELQLWAGNPSAPEDYADWRLWVRVRRDAAQEDPWVLVMMAGAPPEIWAITDGTVPERLLVRATTGGVGPRTLLRMIRLDPAGRVSIGRKYSAGGAACD